MLILGLAGQAGCGKDTVADHLVQRYGFVKFAFSDGIYFQLAQAYGLPDQDALRDRRYKELPVEALALDMCADKAFVKVARAKIVRENPDAFFDLDSLPLSPRWLLQTWGGEYRRGQDENYWVTKAAEFVQEMHNLAPYPELRPALFVECGTRHSNEQDWIHSTGGNVWHLYRGDGRVLHDHASAQPLPVLPGEREIWNNSTIEHLHMAVDMLLSTSNQFVRCEPMEELDGHA